VTPVRLGLMMMTMVEAAAQQVLGGLQLSDVVLGALITAVVGGVSTVLNGLVKGWFDLRIAHVNRQLAGNPSGHDAPRTRSWFAVLGTAAATALLISNWGQLTDRDTGPVSGVADGAGTASTPEDGNPGSGEVGVPPGSSAAPTPTSTAAAPTSSPVSLEDEAEAFLATWSQVARSTRDPRVFEAYWRFPANWYNADDLQSAEELIGRLAPLPTGPRRCLRQPPEIDSIEDDGSVVSITAHVDWEAPAIGKRGSSPVMYVLEHSNEGEAFRIRDVSEPPRTPVACE